MSHSRQTEHYGLPLYNGTDIINPLTDFNNANEAIDEAVYNANQRSVEAEESAQQSAQTVTQYDARVTEAETTATNAGIKAENTQKMIAEEFNPLKEGGYKIGDSVIYNQHLYTFINPHTGAWDASDVKEQPISDALEDTIAEAKVEIQRALTEAIATIASQMVRVDNTQKMIGEPFNPNKEDGYEKGDIVTFADKLWMFNEDHMGAWTGTDVDIVDAVKLIESVNADLYSITGAINENIAETNTRVDAVNDSLAETNTRVDANNGGTVVQIAGKFIGGGLPSGGYVIPSDGYLTLHNSQYSGDSVVKAVVTGANNIEVGTMQVNQPYDVCSLFVKKGMIVSEYSLVTGTSEVLQTWLSFVPFM